MVGQTVYEIAWDISGTFPAFNKPDRPKKRKQKRKPSDMPKKRTQKRKPSDRLKKRK